MRTILFLIFTLTYPVVAVGAEPSAKSSSIRGFRIPNSQQEMVDVRFEDSKLTVVCFLGTECPLAKLYAPRLVQLAEEYGQDVRFFAVNSNRQDTVEDLATYAKTHGLSFPMLKDHRNVVADQFGAVRTPEVFLIDEQAVVRYRGRVDDQYSPGLAKLKPTHDHLRIAIDELLAGRPVSKPTTEAVGCFIGRVKEPVLTSEVTYCDQIVRVLRRNCVECHREGEIGPFQLEEYDEVVGWADTMVEVVDEGRMPPWHANPAHGEFVNSRNMSSKDKQLLRDWVKAGMPFGNSDQLPPAATYTKGWRLSREPDLILSMSESAFEVPADGTVEYQYFVVDPGFEQDKWITGAQIIPGNPSVVHHSIAFIRPPDGSRFRGIGWLTAYVPGSRTGTLPDGSAVFVPAKSKLVFQQHYTPNGTQQSDLTKIGITFGDDDAITHEVYTIVGIDQEFEIPAHAGNHKVRARVRGLTPNAELLSVSPHMHLRGKSFRLFGLHGSDQSILLDVPQYDFNWQHVYEWKAPLPARNFDRLEFDVTFDNSAKNPVNPDPAEHVSWGDQTWEEMAVAFFAVREPRSAAPSSPTANPDVTDSPIAKSANDVSPAMKKRMAAEAERVMGNFDKNGDGMVSRNEASFAFRRVFGQVDTNRDGQLTRVEIEEAARIRLKK